MYNKFDDPSMIGNWVSPGQEKLTERYVVSVDLAKPETFILELTQEELDFLYERCSRKAQRLEEAGLKDIPCYQLSWQCMHKILEAKNIRKATEEKF